MTVPSLPPAPPHFSSTVSVLNLVKYWDGWSVYKLLCVVHKRLPHNFIPSQDHNFLEAKMEREDRAIFFRKLKERQAVTVSEEGKCPFLSERTCYV